MKKIRAIKVCFLFILILAADVGALDLFIRSIDTQLWPSVRIYLRALDNRGQSIEGLKKEDFLVQTSEQVTPTQRLTPFSDTQEGTDLVLILDTSGTMKGIPLEDAKRAITELLQYATSDDRFTIITFNDDARLTAELGIDRQSLNYLVEEIEVAGTQSALFKAVVRGIRYLQDKGRVGRRAVMVVSDGHDESSGAYTLDDCIREARTGDIPVFSLGFSKGQEIYLENLEKMAERTGGRYAYAATSGELSGLYQDMYERLRKQYILVCEAPQNLQERQQYPLRVSLRHRGQLTAVSSVFTTPRIPVPPEPEKNNSSLFWLGGGLLLILAGCGGFWWWSRKKEGGVKKSGKQGAKKRKPQPAQGKETAPAKEPTQESPQPVEKQDLSSSSSQAEVPLDKEIPKRRRGDTVLMRKPVLWAELVEIAEAGEGERFPLWGERVGIGTRPGNDLVLNDQAISGNHVWLIKSGQRVELEDRGSTNGTFVNGERIKKTDLRDGDRIRMGVSEFIFQLSR
ncbi:MAG: VWA domain-containing protein [Chloroflexi bacterium]|nr:VWA domain-containing protein [Chloroflexota bacterium]